MALTRIPRDWGKDKLATFLNDASDNALASYVQARDSYDKLVQIDDAFLLICSNLTDPPAFGPPFFLLQAHASYRAAAQLAMSGQSAQAFMVMRGCLESALYGHYVHRNPQSFDVWMRREENEDAEKAVRQEFTIRNMKNSLGDVDAEGLRLATLLYEKCVGFGAHPNVAALISAFRVERGDHGPRFKHLYLTAEPEVLRGTMKSVAQIGVGVLLIYRNVFADRYERIGLNQRFDELRDGL